MPTIANGKITIGKLYYFKNKAFPNYALNVWSSNAYPAEPLSNVCLWKFASKDQAQMWAVTGITSAIKFVPICNTALYLDRYTGSGAGATINAHLYAYSSTADFTISNGTLSDTIRIRAVDGGKVLTAYSGVNGRRDGKTAISAGNVYFADSNLGDARQEWIPVEVANSYKNVEKQYLVPPYPVSAVTADYDEDCDMIKAAKAAGGQVVCPKYPYSIHWGIDFAGRNSTTDTTVLRNIKASGYGVVKRIKWETYLGNTVLVKYPNVAYGTGSSKCDVYFLYCHLETISVSVNDGVTPNTQIGVAGNTGKGADSRHLHLEAYTQLITTPQTEGGTIPSVDPKQYFFNSKATDSVGYRTIVPDSAAPLNRPDHCSGEAGCSHTNVLYFYNSDKIYARGAYKAPVFNELK